MKVVVTGPESTGKSTLSEAIAKHFNIDYVPEYSRDYLLARDGKYAESDLLEIAKGQIELEDKFEGNKLLMVCDTSLEVIRVWSEWKYNHCDHFILEQARSRIPDLFLLLKPDLPWQPDPLRENPDDRDVLFAYYQKTLSEYKTKVVEIGGESESRINLAINAIDSFS